MGGTNDDLANYYGEGVLVMLNAEESAYIFASHGYNGSKIPLIKQRRGQIIF